MADDIKQNFAGSGKIQWIGLRPGRAEPMKVVETATISEECGLVGDRFEGKAGSDRMVTLIQQEHLTIIGQLLGQDAIDPKKTRRNIVVSGVNLTALKGKQFHVGDTLLQCTGNCPPCSKMEHNLGFGGYNAMIGHGGITATVIRGGEINVGDAVSLCLTETAVG